jgi:hypothetical protein
MTINTSIFGYFDDPAALAPAFDPGLSVDCPFCSKPLSEPLRTISFTALDNAGERPRSWFYRAHRECHEQAPSDVQTHIESSVMWREAAGQQDTGGADD